VPCHLINIADPADVYTVYNYKKDFHAAFGEIRARNRLPVVVGGTGLYIEAVLRNYEIPEVPEDPDLRAELMAMDRRTLDAELAADAPDLYRSTDRKSKKRIVRSLEIAKHRVVDGGKLQKNSAWELRPVVLCVTWERPRLKERIRERLHARFQQGMVEEVRRLLGSGVPEERIAMFGMEYRHIALFLRDKVDFEKMAAALLHDIEQLAKRQSTYFRGMERRGVAMHWIHEASIEEAVEVLSGYQFEY
jgi:tRNA dimethylallyltransferase